MVILDIQICPKGNYDVTVEKKYYYDKVISNLNISSDNFSLSRHLK